MNQIDEKRLRKHARVKVLCYGGSTINEMKHHITPLLSHNPSHILLHVSTNDSPTKSADEMVIDMLRLKNFIQEILPSAKVIISLPTIRNDSFASNSTLMQYTKKIMQLNIPIMDNSNIHEEHIGRKGLHMNRRGVGRLALNIISLIRQL